MQTIHRQMTIDELFTLFPDKGQKLAQELSNTGLNCVGCCASTYETIEAGMLGHGYGEVELEALLIKLNAILNEPQQALDTINLTEKAAEKYREILAEEGKSDWALRFGEKAAGCSGFEYSLDYSQAARPGDRVFESQGIQIHVQAKSLARLLGCTIDYADGLKGSGFKISNPNVKSSCGCGTSHGY